MSKIRILEINKAYYPHTGGIETLVKQYSEGLGKYPDIEIKTLVCREDSGVMYSEIINNVNVTRAGSAGTYFSCPLSVSFIALFRRLSRDADIIHINVPFPLADMALLLSGYRGRVIVSWHSDVVKQKKLMYLYKPLMEYLLKRADCILVATEGHIEGSAYLPEYSHKCRILPYGINPEKYPETRNDFLKQKAVSPGSIRVFFTGRLVYYKGVDVLLRAFRKVNPECELFIAGTGVLESRLKKSAEDYGIAERVHFLGYLSDEELRQAYAGCDIFVLPSVERSEAFGIVQLEAMIYGKPVINTRLPSGVPYVSIHGKTGITVKPSSPGELARAINALSRNKPLRETMGANGRKRVIENFNEKIIMERFHSIIKEVTE